MSDRTNIEWADATWNLLIGYPGFEVSEQGDIRGPSGRILRPMRNIRGYLYILTNRARPRKVFLHRAVLIAFRGLPLPGQEARHLNGRPDDNRLENLAWGTPLENAADKCRHGTQPRGERTGTAKLTEAQVRELRSIARTASLRELGRRYGVSHTAIRRAITGMKWAHLEDHHVRSNED